ncbi:MAG: hypothetical protein IT289_05940 [Oligoflexia bacterium]|nr:hypothetical protein [Oligoflexia bacterium]
MQAKLFFFINSLIVIFLIIRILSNLRGGRPTPLKTESGSKKPMNPEEFRHRRGLGEKVLNVLFEFEGQSLDAFEVLGVPAGSDLKTCHRAYLDLRKNQAHGLKAEAAWKAIEKHLKF